MRVSIKPSVQFCAGSSPGLPFFLRILTVCFALVSALFLKFSLTSLTLCIFQNFNPLYCLGRFIYLRTRIMGKMRGESYQRKESTRENETNQLLFLSRLPRSPGPENGKPGDGNFLQASHMGRRGLCATLHCVLELLEVKQPVHKAALMWNVNIANGEEGISPAIPQCLLS